jgi:hypothetical protein
VSPVDVRVGSGSIRGMSVCFPRVKTSPTTSSVGANASTSVSSIYSNSLAVRPAEIGVNHSDYLDVEVGDGAAGGYTREGVCWDWRSSWRFGKGKGERTGGSRGK